MSDCTFSVSPSTAPFTEAFMFFVTFFVFGVIDGSSGHLGHDRLVAGFIELVELSVICQKSITGSACRRLALLKNISPDLASAELFGC